MRQSEKFNRIIFFGVAFLVLSFIIACGVMVHQCIVGFNSYSQTSSVNAIKGNGESSDAILGSEAAILESCAAVFFDFENIAAEGNNNDTVDKMLANIVAQSDFDDILLINKDGEAVFSCKRDGSLHKGTSYFEDTMSGDISISNPLIDSDANSSFNVIAVPIKNKNDEIVGVCAGYQKSEKLAEKIKSFLYPVDNTTCYIVSSNGKVLVEVGGTLSIDGLAGADGVRDKNIFTGLLATTLDETQLNQIKGTFSFSGVSNQFSFKNNGKNYLVYYKDLSKIDNINYISVICTDGLNAELSIYLTSCIFMYCLFIFTVAIILVEYFTVQRTAMNKLKSANDSMKEMLFVDKITGYSTWNRFDIDAQELLKSEYLKYAIVSFDIDKFKTFNDIYGHEEGNRILKTIANTVNRNIDDHETFARINSDLFYILMKYDGYEQMINRIKALINSIEYEFTDFVPVLAFGIYKITNKNMPLRKMGDCADVARRTIKGHDQSGYEFFFDDMLERIRQEKIIENDMQTALDTHEFVVYYQPKVLLNGTAMLKGAEALVRWVKDGSLVPPGCFIPLFEKNRFIIKLDYYVMDRVCSNIEKWLRQGKDVVLISVNMSRVHLTEPDFTQRLEDICKSHGIPTSMIEIEITESAANFNNMDLLHTVFNDLKDRGFSISIDDFGSGYSSLNMLKDLPVDVLKIDREFLTDDINENDRANEIIGHVIQLAQALDIETICEGIENEHQVELLRALGCDMAQGFFYSRPMPLEAFEEMLDRHSI